MRMKVTAWPQYGYKNRWFWCQKVSFNEMSSMIIYFSINIFEKVNRVLFRFSHSIDFQFFWVILRLVNGLWRFLLYLLCVFCLFVKMGLKMDFRQKKHHPSNFPITTVMVEFLATPGDISCCLLYFLFQKKVGWTTLNKRKKMAKHEGLP